MINNSKIICPHCEGTGFCRPSHNQAGCSHCIADFRKSQPRTEVPLVLIPCAFCQGTGVIDRTIKESAVPKPDFNAIVLPIDELEKTIVNDSIQIESTSDQSTILRRPVAKPISLLITFSLTLFLICFLLLCCNLLSIPQIKLFFISTDLLIWLITCYLLIPFFYSNSHLETKVQLPSPGEDHLYKIIFKNPFIFYIVTSVIICGSLFFFSLKNTLTTSLNSQLFLLPAFFLLIILFVFIIENYQKRADLTLRISSLIYVTVLTISHLMYCRIAIPNFWSNELLFLIINGIIGTVLSIILIIIPTFSSERIITLNNSLKNKSGPPAL